MVKLNNCGQPNIIKAKRTEISMFSSSLEMYEFYLKLFFEMRKIEIRDNIDNETYDYLCSVAVSKLQEKFDISIKQAVCESLSIFNQNISTMTYREKSLIQGGPIKGPA